MKKLKLWQKQYLSTLLLFILAFYGCIFFIAQNSFSSMFSLAQDTAAEECTMILRAIRTERAIIEGRGGGSVAADAAIVTDYGEYYKRKGVELRFVSGSGAVLYDSFPTGFAPREKSLGRMILAEDHTGARYFYTSAKLGSGTLSYAKNTEEIFADQRQQNILLLGVAGIFTLTLTFGLFFMLRRVYRPVDNLAHELRTPLTAIHGYGEYLTFAAIDEDERLEAASFIMEESKRLQEIVEKLLVLSNQKESETSRMRVSIEGIFRRMEKLYPGIRWRADWKYVPGDAALLDSLIGNLTDNAAKVSENNESIELIARDGCICVMDRGPGMSGEMLAQLNDPAGTERRSETGGAGLGVSICHQIAGLHHAQVVFEQREGGGTVAKVIFLQPPNNFIADPKQGEGMMRKKQGGQ